MHPADASFPGSRRGPGLPESLLWVVVYFLAQLLAFGVFVLVLMTISFGRLPASQTEALNLLLAIELDRSFVPFGVTNLLCLAFLIPLVRLRLGPACRESLRLKTPSRRHLVLIAGSILPLSIVSEQLYRWSMSMWAALAEVWPAFAPWAKVNAVDAMLQFARQESYPVLVVAIALGPAIGEELVFRGLIGRGLISRWGTRTGIVLTSLLFAAAHGFPPHALATIPIGLYLHYVYLSTGSLWTPIIVHFLNNLLVISLAHYTSTDSLPSSPVLLTVSAAYVAWTVVAFTAAFVWTAINS
jgi:uncharacterized protein